MYFDISTLDWKRSYKLLASTVVPRPIAWVVTRNADESINAAPFSFFNYFAGFPPVICIGMSDLDKGPPDSFVNIERTGEFVVNLVPERLAEAMNITAAELAPGVSEIEAAGLHCLPSVSVLTPRIEGSPVGIECRLLQVVDVPGNTGRIVMATVNGIHVADSAVLDEARCYVDTPALHLIGRMESPGWYVRTADRFPMQVPNVQKPPSTQSTQATQVTETE